jgi:hypothetical protein
MRKFVWLIAAAVLVLPAKTWSQQNDQNSAPPAQSQDTARQDATPAPADSLADAARKAREQKKDSAAAPKTFTNDNLPTQGGISTVGDNAGAPASTDNSQAAGAGTDANKHSDEKAWRERFAKLNHTLEQDQSNLAVMQRELSQLQVQYYPDPTKAMQQEYTRSDINNKMADIDKMQAKIEADKQAIADAEDELRKSGGDPGWAR